MKQGATDYSSIGTTHIESALDSSSLVKQWLEMFDHKQLSAFKASILQERLNQLLSEFLLNVPTTTPLSQMQRQRIAEIGTELAQLGMDNGQKVAAAQEMLISRLGQVVAPDLLGAVISTFSRGVYRGIEQRAQLREQELTLQLDEQARLNRLIITFNRQLAQSLQNDESQIISGALETLLHHLPADGVGFFELQEGAWRCQHAVGKLPTYSFIRPMRGNPPLLEDGRLKHYRIDGQPQIAVPLPATDQRLLLFVIGKKTKKDKKALRADDNQALPAGDKVRAAHALPRDNKQEPPQASHSSLADLLKSANLTSQSGISQIEMMGVGHQALHNALTIMSRSLADALHHIWLTKQLNTDTIMPHRALNTRIRQPRGIMIDEEDEIRWLTSSSTISQTSLHQAALPLHIRDHSFGELILEEETDHQWSEDEVALMNVVAEQMSQALEKAWLFQESERRAAQLQAAGEVSRAASSLLALDKLMNEAVKQIRLAFGYYHAQVFLLDEKAEWAILRASTGETGKQLLARKHKLAVGSQSTIGKVTALGKPVVVRDTDSDNAPWRFNQLLPETRAELAVPLRVGQSIIGALDVQSVAPDVFYEDDIAVLQTLADQMAVAIQNARAYEQQLETAEKLREVDKLKTQFLANMSHELRTPLNSIIGFSRVILKGIDGPLSDLQKKDLTTIYNSGQILLQLIDSILDISKIEAGKMELDFEQVDLSQIIDVALSTATGLIKDKPIKLQREIPQNLPKIRADKVRIRQILLNLLSNAAKFTEEGRIRLTVMNLGEEIMISVADSGLGIPPNKQKRLFDPFYQVDGSATRKAGGTGLGLAITKSFVELHGGEIWVQSRGIRGSGSTFYVTLPIKGPATNKDEPQEPPLVLAIDDEPGLTLLYERYLEPEGYRFLACHDPREAIKRTTTLQPGLILVDFNMPHMNGLEVIKALRNHIPTRHIPIILYGIKSANEMKQKALDAGASDFLQKPILRQDLVSSVQRWISNQ